MRQQQKLCRTFFFLVELTQLFSTSPASYVDLLGFQSSLMKNFTYFTEHLETRTTTQRSSQPLERPSYLYKGNQKDECHLSLGTEKTPSSSF
jgi:hypothetical protein